MKTVEKEIKRKAVYYQAYDGTLFVEEEECRIYEQSAKCALQARYQSLVLKTVDASALFIADPSESQVDIIRITSDADEDLVAQLCYLYGSDFKKDVINQARQCSGIVFIDRGYEGTSDFFVLTSKELLLESIEENTKDPEIFD